MEINRYNGRIRKGIAGLFLTTYMIVKVPDLFTYASNFIKDRRESGYAVEEINKTRSLEDMIDDSISKNNRISGNTLSGYELNHLIRAMIEVESGGKYDLVSKQGAVGVMQIMPETIKIINKSLGKKYSVRDMKNPELNIEYGLHHFLDKYCEFKDKKEEDRVKFAVAGYIGIPKKIRSRDVKTWKDAVSNINYWPKDRYGTNAKMYVNKVIRNYDKYSRESKTIKIARLDY